MPLLKKDLEIKKVLNNSSLIATDLFNEYVLMGRGIAFGKKESQTLSKGTEFDKMYKLSMRSTEFNRIVNGYDSDIVDRVMGTIHLITAHDNDTFTGTKLVSLADHLAGTFLRIERDEPIKSFFTHEIKALYPVSYDKSLEICNTVEELYKVEIPDTEVSYIALHIENLNVKNGLKVDLLNSIIFEVEDLIVRQNGYTIDKDSIHYSRFITHIKFIIESYMSNKKPLGEDVSGILKQTFVNQAAIADGIVSIIEHELNISLDSQESTYLLIHLINIIP